MKKHYFPKTIDIVQRFKFTSQVRQPGESISVYMLVLQALPDAWNYGPALNDMLCYQLVVGVQRQLWLTVICH